MARQRGRNDVVDAVDAHDLFDKIGLAVDIRAPGRNRNLEAFTRAFNTEAELPQDRDALLGGNLETGQALHLGNREIDDLWLIAGIADHFRLGGLATAELEHELGGALKAGHHVFRVDTTLETVTRIGDDAERAAGLGDVHRIPERRFDQHVGGVLVAAGMLAAHDAADRFDRLFVRYDDVVGAELVFALVERQHRLAVPGAADRQVALDLGGVEDVHRSALVEGHVVGDVDQSVDRAKADRQQPLLHPLRRRAVLDAAHEPQREAGAQVPVFAEVERQLHRRFAFDGEGGRRPCFQRAEAGGREVTGNAVDTGAVRAVRRQVDLDHRIVETGIGGVARTDRRVSRQVDDAVVVFGDLQLLFRAHHAAAFDTADGADGERHVDAGHVGSGSGKGADEAGARIRRAADDLDRGARAGVDHQHAQFVGIRMLLGRDDLGDDEGLEGGLVVDVLDLEPDHRQPRADLFQRSVGIKVVLEPGKREFHDFTCVLEHFAVRWHHLTSHKCGKTKRKSGSANECERIRSDQLRDQAERPPNSVGMSSGRKP
ncbi:hypothetical protein D9M68_373650 [compost metagenome]